MWQFVISNVGKVTTLQPNANGNANGFTPDSGNHVGN